jgi:single-stranded-DNA-specific exonuclease
MKERHLRLELAQNSDPAIPSSASIRAIGWDQAVRAATLGLTQGSLIDIAYRIRENDHPEYGGIEVEIAGIEPAGSRESYPKLSEAHG